MISYSHDSEAHKELVLRLAYDLVRNGINAIIDRDVEDTGVDWGLWTAKSIRDADFVLAVCTSRYYQISMSEVPENDLAGRGVAWEASMIRDILYQSRHTSKKIIPVLFPGATVNDVPEYLRGRGYYVINTQQDFDALVNRLTGQRALQRPVPGDIPLARPREPEPLRFPLNAPAAEAPGISALAGAPDRFAFFHRCKEVHEQIHKLCGVRKQLEMLTEDCMRSEDHRRLKWNLAALKGTIESIYETLDPMRARSAFPDPEQGWIDGIRIASETLDDAQSHASAGNWQSACTTALLALGHLNGVVRLKSDAFNILIKSALERLRIAEIIQELRDGNYRVNAQTVAEVTKLLNELPRLEEDLNVKVPEHDAWQNVYHILRLEESKISSALHKGNIAWWEKLRTSVRAAMAQAPLRHGSSSGAGELTMQEKIARAETHLATAMNGLAGSDPDLACSTILAAFREYRDAADEKFLCVDGELLGLCRNLDRCGNQLRNVRLNG